MRAVAVLLAALVSTPLLAAERNEVTNQTYPFTEGKRLVIDVGPLDVALRFADISEIRVQIELQAAGFTEKQAEAWVSAHRPTIEDGERVLRITAPDPRGLQILKGVVITRAHVSLVIPMAMEADLTTTSGNVRVDGENRATKTLRLRSASGDLTLDGWATLVEMRTTSGDISIRASRAIDSVLARTSSGEVLLSGGARELRCDTSSGDVRLSGLLAPAAVVTTSGDVSASFDALRGPVHIETASGRVRVTLPPGAAPSGEILSATGEIRSVYAGESAPEGGRLTLAGTGPAVQISTSSGRVDLQ